jgi:hypothetical protein
LRWQLHDLWPKWEIPTKAPTQPGWQTKVANRVANGDAGQAVAPAITQCWQLRHARAPMTLYRRLKFGA